ncbi:type II toxin-antitoxin system RelE/ParE family toxin [Photobacterium sanguinicancri]|uniref:type II toxin-antitoxin system RelE/ParE family toxin n=1 Tax=Photobacterium sanguinicancri TaxID=875932 RepID=UPI0026E251F3|nr:type II toxin-antitoxin system RelE/ParE family toxin [Photobacterium sanguinicancri]MDO6501181.1 type II toxin-antitoxin system RelE/ParE family toxin [Photobacterium sanguinicancri]
MTNYSIKWDRQSLDDRARIYEFMIDNANDNVADGIEDKIKETAKLLAQFPEMGKSKHGTPTSTRLFSIQKTPYLLLYVPDKEKQQIQILRVFHSKQKYL